MRPIITGYLDQEGLSSFEDKIKRAKALGIDYVALRHYQKTPLIELSDKEIKSILQLLKDEKVKVSYIDTNIKPFDLYDDKAFKNALDEFKYMVKFSDKFKATHLLMKLPLINDVIEEWDVLSKKLEAFIDIAMRSSKKIVLEHTESYKSNVYAYIFKKIKSKDLLMFLDPIVIMKHHESITTSYRLFRHKIGIVQAVDTDEFLNPMLIGYGKTNILSAFKKLLRDRFDGFISIDNHFYSNVFKEPEVKPGFFKRIFTNEKKKKEQYKQFLSQKIFPNEETKNVTYDDILENQIKVIQVIFK